ncbi:MAG: very short patch repair endonuclease [Opitutus sp.]
MKEKGEFVHGRGTRIAGKTRQYPGNTRGVAQAETRSSSGGSDVYSPAKRSAVMARIRGRGNKDTELKLIALLRIHKIAGWRRGRRLAGRPDFVFPRERVVVFVDGCFWHGCPNHATWPKQNAEFWRRKILGNRKRDRTVTRLLRLKGWRVVRIWEHALTKKTFDPNRGTAPACARGIVGAVPTVPF